MDKIDLRYQRGKIYTVRCYDDDTAIYVGSTIQPLSTRMAKHRSQNSILCEYVNGNWKNWYIELYEEYPCNNKQLLEKREGEIIRLIGNINKNIAGRTNKEYREDNKEKIKQYWRDNKDKKYEKNKRYRESHKEQLKEKKKQYCEANKEKKAETDKKYREANKEKIADKEKQKAICDHCGCEITKRALNVHKKTKKCINFVKS